MTQTFIEDPPYLQRSVAAAHGLLGPRIHGPLARHPAGGARQGPAGRLARGGVDPLDAHHLLRWRWWPSSSRELVTDEPIVNLRILGDRNFATGTVLITAMGVVLYGTTALLPLFLQTLLGYPALEAGLATSPRGLGALLSAIVVGRLVGVLDARLLVAVGFGFLGPVRGLALAAHLRRGVVEHRVRDVPERARQPAHLHRALHHVLRHPAPGADGRRHRDLQPDAQPGRQRRHLGGHHAALPARAGAPERASWRG